MVRLAHLLRAPQRMEDPGLLHLDGSLANSIPLMDCRFRVLRVHT